ncbi:hypothetical protein BREVNS_0378 [Brevinematales bacterium NS]|nr:hypothetical protein BREVNS_0378 [Brevinematales bacterium NS]
MHECSKVLKSNKNRNIIKNIYFYNKKLITFPTGDLKEREKDKEVTPGSKDFCQL